MKKKGESLFQYETGSRPGPVLLRHPPPCPRLRSRNLFKVRGSAYDPGGRKFPRLGSRLSFLSLETFPLQGKRERFQHLREPGKFLFRIRGKGKGKGNTCSSFGVRENQAFLSIEPSLLRGFHESPSFHFRKTVFPQVQESQVYFPD